ncbi:AraC family transcriptional regulator [Methylobacterium sp. GXF4]|jgi:AraC-like DNA-binding protein|uniref:helix-turn-helix domain-containing protein n=1 Tax=Methylobacterium TaxID=407 RepID=UPI0002697F80|nr:MULTISPECIES: helix-turn-helix domain-containing protein [Methylobacterium]EIZ85993.1 AraC family transcriptional regulator [Methylobacterium sp. GXF4]SFJ33535.1 AraC-type DNA-binding protein [Methylobacterium brachiatum]
MRLLFSTDNLPVNTRFKRWLETLEEQRLPLEQERLGSGPFEAKLESATLGPLTMTRVSEGPLRSEATPRAIRRLGDEGWISVAFTLAGATTVGQRDRTSKQRQGDLVVIEHQPTVITTSPGNQSLYLKMPRERLESVLGPARRYAALTVGAELATATLAMSFFEELSRMHHRLDPVTGARMGSIGVDLIVASIAERIALDAPLPASGDILVQRAKAHVEAHLGDPALDPPRLAAAVGVSLRRLQALFDERGQHVSDWIWQRRLEVAADRLADPTCTHLTIDTLAGGCGFASRAHFSRRFKGRFGLAPSDFRRAVGLGLQ